MRDVFDSDAVHRDNDDPFVPGDGKDRRRSRSAFDWANVSHALMPNGLRDRAISVSIRTNKRRYELEEPVHVQVRLWNRIPFPVTLKTRSPVRWSWAVDGVEEASHVSDHPPDEPALFQFSRSETKTYKRRWSQRIQDVDGRWTPVTAGEYELSAWINVDRAVERGLSDSTTISVD